MNVETLTLGLSRQMEGLFGPSLINQKCLFLVESTVKLFCIPKVWLLNFSFGIAFNNTYGICSEIRHYLNDGVEEWSTKEEAVYLGERTEST